MISYIYRSPKRDQTYLYITQKDDFSDLPEALLNSFGEPQFAMLINLDKREKLASADIEKVKLALSEQGYYLQVPPPVTSLLSQHFQAK